MSHAFMMFYPGDYLRDTGHLSTEEHGAYLLLLCHAWTQNGVLPLDDDLLRRITRLPSKSWAKARSVIMAFFTLQDDGYHQKRMDKELAKARAMVAKRREAVERTQQWRAANPPQKPNGHGPPDDPPVMHNVMHNDRITEAQQGHNVMAPPRPPLPEPQSEPVPKEERSLINKNSFLQGTRARPERLPDGLEALLTAAGVTLPEPEPLADPERVVALVRGTKRALEMRIPYGEVRAVEAQLDALKAQPAAVGSEASMGLLWQPPDPVRTPAQQFAELTGCSLAEAEAKFAA